jgi:CubicO group peptidase (beta-lactamase class C family)
MARFFAMLAGRGQFRGVRLLSEDRVRSFLEPCPDTYSPDRLLNRVGPIGKGGLRISGDGSHPANAVVGPGRSVVWHPGSGGSIAWADLDSGLGVSICHNWMQPSENQVPAFLPLGDAIRAKAAEARSTVALRSG